MSVAEVSGSDFGANILEGARVLFGMLWHPDCMPWHGGVGKDPGLLLFQGDAIELVSSLFRSSRARDDDGGE